MHNSAIAAPDGSGLCHRAQPVASCRRYDLQKSIGTGSAGTLRTLASPPAPAPQLTVCCLAHVQKAYTATAVTAAAAVTAIVTTIQRRSMAARHSAAFSSNSSPSPRPRHRHRRPSPTAVPRPCRRCPRPRCLTLITATNTPAASALTASRALANVARASPPSPCPRHRHRRPSLTLQSPSPSHSPPSPPQPTPSPPSPCHRRHCCRCPRPCRLRTRPRPHRTCSPRPSARTRPRHRRTCSPRPSAHDGRRCTRTRSHTRARTCTQPVLSARALLTRRGSPASATALKTFHAAFKTFSNRSNWSIGRTRSRGASVVHSALFLESGYNGGLREDRVPQRMSALRIPPPLPALGSRIRCSAQTSVSQFGIRVYDRGAKRVVLGTFQRLRNGKSCGIPVPT